MTPSRPVPWITINDSFHPPECADWEFVGTVRAADMRVGDRFPCSTGVSALVMEVKTSDTGKVSVYARLDRATAPSYYDVWTMTTFFTSVIRSRGAAPAKKIDDGFNGNCLRCGKRTYTGATPAAFEHQGGSCQGKV